MSIFDRIFEGNSEHELFNRSKTLIDYATAVNKMRIEVINGSDDLKPIHDIEHLSDKAVFELTTAITSGAVAPNLIDDMTQFVSKEDDIVDTIFNLSRAIVRYRKTKKRMDKFTKEKLLALAKLTNYALILLYEMHKVNTLDEAMKLRKKVESVEKAGDELKDALLDYAYQTKMDFRYFYYVQDVAYLSDDILDACEDTSDMIVSIMRSILT